MRRFRAVELLRRLVGGEAAWTWEEVPWRRVSLRGETARRKSRPTITVEFAEGPIRPFCFTGKPGSGQNREYLRLYERWGSGTGSATPFHGARSGCRRRPPREQRAVLILKITALEFVLFLAAVVIFLIAWERMVNALGSPFRGRLAAHLPAALSVALLILSPPLRRLGSGQGSPERRRARPLDRAQQLVPSAIAFSKWTVFFFRSSWGFSWRRIRAWPASLPQHGFFGRWALVIGVALLPFSFALADSSG